jgi:purine-binding chemotaxis protein CheW
MPDVRPYCTFRVDGLWLGVDVLEVQEVIRHRTPTRVPTAPPVIQGLINLRGQIVTVLDLRGRLGLAPPGPLFECPMNVVVRAQGGAVGLVVDEMGDVLEVDEASLGRPPETIPEAVRRVVSGLYPSEGRSLLVLDIAKVVE